MHEQLKREIGITLCGSAGQGIETVERLLASLATRSGYQVFSSKEFMSRVRGGVNSLSMRISTQAVQAFHSRIDVLIIFEPAGFEHLADRISPDTLVISDPDKVPPPQGIANYIPFPFAQLASQVGGIIYQNSLAFGLVSRLLGLEINLAEAIIREHFGSKTDDIVDKNISSVRLGYDGFTARISSLVRPLALKAGRILVTGADAVGMGALAGGCDFIGSYPMSPATAVLNFFATHGRKFDVLVEQAEDEIAAINMGLGAWYAGARAMVTTSGGGYDLMTEGVSLAGIIESPMVLHIAQRPGPATGLPTRTEQGDLNLVLYSGHGDYPRAVLSPGTPEEAFELTRHAFEIADRHQTPVFVLTDQYFLDSTFQIEPFAVDTPVQKHIVQTDKSYLRYQVTEDGISPRGIPQHGQGLVMVDSDEHDESGHITESASVRTTMTDKRMKKAEALVRDALPPVIVGSETARTLVVVWGSLYPIAREALEELGRDDLALLHCPQVYPLHPRILEKVSQAEKVIFVEQNVTGQFAELVRSQAEIRDMHKILKYDGHEFSVEYIVQAVRAIL